MITIQSIPLSYSTLNLHLDAVEYSSRFSKLQLDILKQAYIP